MSVIFYQQPSPQLVYTVYAKGQTETQRHRFLAKNGGWVWLVTQATILCGQNGTNPKAVVCLHFVTR